VHCLERGRDPLDLARAQDARRHVLDVGARSREQRVGQLGRTGQEQLDQARALAAEIEQAGDRLLVARVEQIVDQRGLALEQLEPLLGQRAQDEPALRQLLE